MKKTALIMAIAVIISCFTVIPTSAAEAEDITAQMSNIVRGEWEFRDGVLCSTEANGGIGDAIVMSDIFVDSGERVTYSADITIKGGNNSAAGFCIAELDPSMPLEGGCVLTPLDISAGQAKLFAYNAQTSCGSYQNTSIKVNETFNMRLEIYDDSTMEIYINNELKCQGINTNFPGGYLGIYTFSGYADFKNITVEYDGEGSGVSNEKPTSVLPGTYKLDGSNTTPIMGQWEGTVSVPANVDKEAITMSDYYFEAGKHLTVTADVKITDGAALALLLSETSKVNPLGGGALIYNIDAKSDDGVSRLFSFSASYAVTDNYAQSFELNKAYKLRLEIFADGSIEAYIDDQLAHNLGPTGFTGGYLGLYTWAGAGTFENVEAVYGGKAPEKLPVATETTEPQPDDSTTATTTGGDSAGTDEVITSGNDTTASVSESTAEIGSETDKPSDNGSKTGLIIGIVAAVVVIAVVAVIVIKKKNK